MQITSHWEHVFETLVKKAKIIEEVKRMELENKGKQIDQSRRKVGLIGPNL